jgi:hypothetical protein
MGCCTSSAADVPNSSQQGGNNKPLALPPRIRGSAQRNSGSRGVDPSDAAVEIILRVKRANVYTQGVSDEIQTNYEAKVIHKTEEQSKSIRKFGACLKFVRLLFIFHSVCLHLSRPSSKL